MIYFATRLYVKIALWFFFKELDVKGLENIPKDQPVLFTPNHQNSFIDAILIACIVHRPIHYLVRASVFKSKIAKWLLSQLNMMPIYRFRDGLKEVKKNDQIMNTCTEILCKNKWMMVFPEGNHDMKYAIRPLQKGVARIAFQTIDQHQKEVLIIPVGIYYEDHTAFRSRVLINFGKTISTQKHYQTYKTDPQKGFSELMHGIGLKMKQLTLHISPKQDYARIIEIWQSRRIIKSNIVDQFNSDQEIITEVISNKISQKKDQNQSKTKDHKWVKFPLVIYGIINHIIPYWVVRWIIKSKVTDIHFYSSIKLAIGMILVPLFYGIQALILQILGVAYYWIILYILTLPGSGIIAFNYWNNKSSS